MRCRFLLTVNERVIFILPFLLLLASCSAWQDYSIPEPQTPAERYVVYSTRYQQLGAIAAAVIRSGRISHDDATELVSISTSIRDMLDYTYRYLIQKGKGESESTLVLLDAIEEMLTNLERQVAIHHENNIKHKIRLSWQVVSA